MSAIRTELIGSGRPRFAFLHGLLGRGRNWTQIASSLAAAGYACVLFDLPNHGGSAWTSTFSYPGMAEAVADEIDQRMGSAARLILLGHSMGGKVAMLTALTRPELVSGLVVVDIAPAPSDQTEEFESVVAAMQALDLTTLGSRAEADLRLRAQVPKDDLRVFALQNLRRKGGWHWQPNLDLLAESMTEIGGWPYSGSGTYQGPVLWLTGERSAYCRPEHDPEMHRLFPRVEHLVVPDAGHWVHADAPTKVVSALIDFADRVDPS